MKRKHKKKRSIFTKLVISFFLFSTVAILVIVVCTFAELLIMGSGDMNRLVPDRVVLEDGSLGSLDGVYMARGWVEKLDENYQVVEVFGEKKTERYSYTEKELLEATMQDVVKSDYRTFYEPIEGGCYLFCYPKDVVSIQMNFEVREMDGSPAAKAVWVVMFALLIIDGVIASWYIYRKIRKPLKEIGEGMRRVTDGEEKVRLSFRAEGEFMEIVDSFNIMIDRLEQEKAERAKLQKERNQMLLELSHDLKTPLATIKSSAAALSEGIVDETDLERYYNTIAMKGDRVNKMADDMFTMLKMESNDYCPDMKEVDFCEIVRQICAEYYEEMSHLEIDINIPEYAIKVMADERLITRTAANLVTNAIKYNQTGSKLAIKLSEKIDSVSLIVSDDGTEIADEVKERMFLAFVRGDASRRTTGGTGLGLAIARSIARKHGGDVTYRYEDQRNRFVLTLPTIPGEV